MCGIVGFNSKNSNKLESMLKSITHRGPDDLGVYESDICSLGHVRLSILDLSSHGHQPMIYEYLSMVYNGEVYNFKDIREDLVRLGYTFTSDTDSEVILKAYHAWGIKAVGKFIGMFAIAFYNARSSELILIRDRVGVKPLYYYQDGCNFVFASELKPIMKYKEDLAISKDALGEYFQFGYISSNLSIFKNCYKLPAGHYGTYNLKENKFELNEYWSILPFFSLPKFQKTEEELIDELEALLIDAFKYRMVADVPVGVFLSGGIDSSIVAAILQKHHGNIHTFTIGFKEAKYNEASYAKDVAKYLGTKHTEKFLGAKEAKKILEQYVDIYDEPFGDSSGIPTTMVSQVAKDSGVKVVLSADGGDEIFCGYGRYWKTWKRGKNIFRLPYYVRKIIAFTISTTNNIFHINLSHKLIQIKSMFLCKNWQCIYENMLQFVKKEKLNKALGIKNNTIKTPFKSAEVLHPMQGMMLWDYHRYMVDDILTKVDRATMSVSIEGREPLLDHRIAEFMAQVPFKYKYKDGTSKYLLRKVLERYIPNELIDRPKMGFGIPLFEWFKNDLSGMFKSYLSEEKIKQHGLYNFDLVSKPLKDMESGQKLGVGVPWLALIFEMWYEKYMKKQNGKI